MSRLAIFNYIKSFISWNLFFIENYSFRLEQYQVDNMHLLDELLGFTNPDFS